MLMIVLFYSAQKLINDLICGVRDYFICQGISERFKAQLKGSLYKKSLKKPVSREKEFSSDAILELYNSDIGKMGMLHGFIAWLIEIPCEFFGSLASIILLLGWSAIIPVILCILSGFLFNLICKIGHEWHKKMGEAKKEKMEKIHDIYGNIRYIKMEAMEDHYSKKISEAQQEETYWWKWCWYNGGIHQFYHHYTGNGIWVLVILTYFYFIGELSAEVIFTIGSAYGRMKHIMHLSNHIMEFYKNTKTAFANINNYLISEELDCSQMKWVKSSNNDDIALEIKNGDFYYTDEKKSNQLKEKKKRTEEEKKKETFAFFRRILRKLRLMKPKKEPTEEELKKKEEEKEKIEKAERKRIEKGLKPNEPEMNLNNLNFQIKKGKCVAIIGKCGSGKTSLIKSLFGELYSNKHDYLLTETKANRVINGKVSYVPQDSWVLSDTIKNNILFYSEFNQEMYDNAIYYSGLTSDLEEFPDRDNAMLGDKGINLSGGQKARLGVARALYANSDIVLMDDPISALDVKVGRFIMEETVHGYLKGKTTVIATHAIPFMKYFDEIWIMDEGKLIHKGNYEEIQQNEEFKAIKESMINCDEKNKKEEEEEKKKEGKTDIDMLFGSSSDSEKDSTSTESSPTKDLTLEKKKSVKAAKKIKDQKLKLKKEESATEKSRKEHNNDKNELISNII